MNLLIPSVLAFMAGVSVVVQQILNANLRSELNSAVWSGFMSYLLGVISMIALAAALREPIPSMSVISRIPWWAWCGGFFGAIFIIISILIAKQLGAAMLIALLVAGQMCASIVIDHFVCHKGPSISVAWSLSHFSLEAWFSFAADFSFESDPVVRDAERQVPGSRHGSGPTEDLSQ